MGIIDSVLIMLNKLMNKKYTTGHNLHIIATTLKPVTNFSYKKNDFKLIADLYLSFIKLTRLLLFFV